MQIKNILTNDIDIVEDFIISELCKYCIPYTFIEQSHELHFGNYILRFYDKKSVFKALKNYVSVPTIEENIKKVTGLSDYIEKQKLRPNYNNYGMINKKLKKSININNRFYR